MLPIWGPAILSSPPAFSMAGARIERATPPPVCCVRAPEQGTAPWPLDGGAFGPRVSARTGEEPRGGAGFLLPPSRHGRPPSLVRRGDGRERRQKGIVIRVREEKRKWRRSKGSRAAQVAPTSTAAGDLPLRRLRLRLRERERKNEVRVSGEEAGCLFCSPKMKLCR